MSQAIPDWLTRAVKLTPDNFTPLSRTPWGGANIARRYKHALVPASVGQRIGEAWEFSCDPAFPSRVQPTGEELLAVIGRWPEAVLSPQLVATQGAKCEILVKLLDAAEPLSLQVHPADDDRNLHAGECGKPESWLILAAEPGAGIYLGFAKAVSRAVLKAALLAGEAAREYMHFVPVKPGDYFEIQPGVTHAIGGGVTLLEPQRILTGQAGKTYRLWDWGRRYAASGQLDPVHGQPRELHVDASLPLIDPEHQVGEAFTATLRRHAKVSERPGGVSVREFPANPYYKTVLCHMPAGSSLTLTIGGGYGALVMLEGQIEAASSGGVETLPAGQSALLPHAAMPLRLTATAQSAFSINLPAATAIGF